VTYHVLKHFPRLTTVALSYVAAFLLFLFLGPDFFEGLILPFGLLGILVAGVLYSYSFTASVGALILVSVAHDYAPGVAAVVGGIGALLADIAIFKFIREDLKREIGHIAKTEFMRLIGSVPIVKERWFRNVFGALILASPFPDEIGIAIMASAKIEEGTFTLLAFIADMFGIYLLVIAAQVAF
jgi:hypothetical protein